MPTAPSPCPMTMQAPLSRASLLVLLLLTSALAGCFGDDVAPPEPEPPIVLDNVWVTDGSGASIDGVPVIPMTWTTSAVGEDGPEPSIGITSDGCMFFVALEKVMRSCDHDGQWTEVQDFMSQPTTSDPYLWVDPATDRVFNVQMVSLLTTWIAFTDDGGDTWIGNPYDSGPTPLNDHIKLGTGPWTDEGYGIIGQNDPVYPQAVYFCYNKLAGIFCYTSFDGGATFEVGGQVYGLVTTNGGLHGAITSAPDGTVYLTPRVPTPTIVYSKDNGLSWTTETMGGDAGTTNPRKNSEVGTDSESNAYHVWTGMDQGVYMSRSTDSGVSWEQESLRISPIDIISTTFPQIDAGDPGRIAITYLGSENESLLGTEDIDGDTWEGNAHYAPHETHYHLYVTVSLNALDAEPIFHTYRVSDDPVQIGSICLNSGDCRSEWGGSNRNLLDFNDLTIDLDGRIHVAFTDGCTGDCALNHGPLPENSRDRAGVAWWLESGPSLYVANDPMEPIGNIAE